MGRREPLRKLEQWIRKYQNLAVEAAQVIEEMISLAKGQIWLPAGQTGEGNENCLGTGGVIGLGSGGV